MDPSEMKEGRALQIKISPKSSLEIWMFLFSCEHMTCKIRSTVKKSINNISECVFCGKYNCR